MTVSGGRRERCGPVRERALPLFRLRVRPGEIRLFAGLAVPAQLEAWNPVRLRLGAQRTMQRSRLQDLPDLPGSVGATVGRHVAVGVLAERAVFRFGHVRFSVVPAGGPGLPDVCLEEGFGPETKAFPPPPGDARFLQMSCVEVRRCIATADASGTGGSRPNTRFGRDVRAPRARGRMSGSGDSGTFWPPNRHTGHFVTPGSSPRPPRKAEEA